MSNPIDCRAEDAPKLWQWCQTRGGVARWRSVNLSNPGASWSTPALTENGQPTKQPTWQADIHPELVETDPSKITVYTDRELKRFRVAIRRGGFSFKCTEASSRKIRAAVEKAGVGAYHVFDYDTQEAVI